VTLADFLAALDQLAAEAPGRIAAAGTLDE